MHFINFIKEVFKSFFSIDNTTYTIEDKVEAPKPKRKYTKRKPAEAGLPVEKKKRGRPAKVKQ